MDERLRFVARLLEGEKMAALCAEFGISRKTGYKIYDRYKDCGVQGLTDRSRRPQRLERGDLGTVIQVYADGKAFEVEFMTLDGRTAAVATVVASAVRPVTGRDISHSRHLQGS